ncbi:MAG TPA: hypothetical protein VKK61_10620 [Tepidisphaeraceae bacterium]|nr:hypothetical protein [Tepidisphaeraceae bacterium]
MSQWSSDKAGILLLVIAAVGWYIASRATADALSAGKSSPGKTAIGCWIPTFVVVIAAIVLGRSEVVTSIIFGASVAALTIVLGVVTIAAGETQQTSPRRMWGFILPAALICLMIGFTSAISWFDACVLFLEGLALASLWNDQAEKIPPSRLSPGRSIQLIIAIAAAVVATLAGLRGVWDVSGGLGIGDGLVTQVLLGPLLVLPMIGMGCAAASEGRYDQAVSTLVGYVLLNLCALLPLAALLWFARPYWTAVFVTTNAPTTLPATMPAGIISNPLPYPMGIWRVDTVCLAAIGLLLLPVALGRWTLGRAEAVGLMFAYVIYMFLSALLAR